MVRNYTDDELLERVKQLPNFLRIPKEIWILGVRSMADLPGKFDDKFYVFDGEKNIMVLTGTTHPGLTILKHFEKYNSLGAAVVKSDEWYYGLWKYGMHKGKIPALLQLGSEISVYRDGDKDGHVEETGAVHRGYYGINFHTNTYDLSDDNTKIDVLDIGAWSAGCQVPNERDKYVELMKIIKRKHENKIQTLYTYCLIKEF